MIFLILGVLYGFKHKSKSLRNQGMMLMTIMTINYNPESEPEKCENQEEGHADCR
jgi:hypothetical protein